MLAGWLASCTELMNRSPAPASTLDAERRSAARRAGSARRGRDTGAATTGLPSAVAHARIGLQPLRRPGIVGRCCAAIAGSVCHCNGRRQTACRIASVAPRSRSSTAAQLVEKPYSPKLPTSSAAYVRRDARSAEVPEPQSDVGIKPPPPNVVPWPPSFVAEWIRCRQVFDGLAAPVWRPWRRPRAAAASCATAAAPPDRRRRTGLAITSAYRSKTRSVMATA